MSVHMRMKEPADAVDLRHFREFAGRDEKGLLPVLRYVIAEDEFSVEADNSAALERMRVLRIPLEERYPLRRHEVASGYFIISSCPGIFGKPWKLISFPYFE